MFEFVLAQMTKANTLSCNELNSSMISTIKNTTGGWSDKFQNIVLTSNFPNIKTVPLNNS